MVQEKRFPAFLLDLETMIVGSIPRPRCLYVKTLRIFQPGGTMYFKSLLAATIVTLSAVVWQVRFVPDDDSTRAEETQASQTAEPAPSWVANPESFLDGSHTGVVVATGSAKIRGNITMAHNRAMLKARMNLVKAKGAAQGTTRVTTTRTLPDGKVETTVRSENPTTKRSTKSTSDETLTFERVDGKLDENRELARWTSPDGVLWVLVASGR